MYTKDIIVDQTSTSPKQVNKTYVNILKNKTESVMWEEHHDQPIQDSPLRLTRCYVSSAGATLSQLSDSGQTLSEDSGVDIAEAGGLSKDGSPRPSKSQQGHVEQPGAMRQVGLHATVTHSRSKQSSDSSRPAVRFPTHKPYSDQSETLDNDFGVR